MARYVDFNSGSKKDEKIQHIFNCACSLPTDSNCKVGSDPNGYNTTANMAAVNLRQAASDIGGNIVEITAREAQDLANQGYTVVAARENTMGGSGHIATVRPRHEFNEVSGPTMNNIGAASRTGERNASDSFAGGYERGEVHFYYDREQFD